MRKNWHIKQKKDLLQVRPKNLIFVHDSPLQKQNFLKLIAWHIHHPSQLENEKIDNE